MDTPAAKEALAEPERVAAEAKGLIGVDTTRFLPPEEAIAECREVVRLRPDDAQAHLCLALALDRKGMPDEAVAQCREAVRLKGDCFEAHALLGSALARQGKTDQAVAAWREAVGRYESGPPHPPGADLQGLDRVYEQLTLTLRTQGRLEEARSLLERGILIQKADPNLHAAGQMGASRRGLLASCLAHLAETLLHLKDHAAAAGVASELSDLRAAQYLVRCLQLAEADEKTPEPERRKVAQGYAAQAMKLAADVATALTASRPKPTQVKEGWVSDLADNWLSLAYVRLDLGDTAGGREASGHAVALVPDNLERCWAHAAILLLAGDVAGYRQLCSRVLERFGQTKDRREANLTARLCTLGPDAVPDPTLLAPVAQRAVDGGPGTGWSLHTLGMAYYRGGKFDLAVQSFQKSLDIKPRWDADVCNWLALAMAHQRLGHAEEARQWLDKATHWIDGAAALAPRASAGPLPGIHPHDGLACRLAHREAEKLLAASGKPPPPDK
jgi:tetratricopeptide (TPR) repeat protein